MNGILVMEALQIYRIQHMNLMNPEHTLLR